MALIELESQLERIIWKGWTVYSTTTKLKLDDAGPWSTTANNDAMGQ